MRRLLVLAALAMLGCTETRSARCKEVCKREAECVDSTGSKMPFDEKECVAACAALEADKADNGAKVERHIDCVHKQQQCSAILECK
ncbi:MAG: hypothetical protein H0T46_18375 [Deltaproteobacteria bacterium]|nr:hypothetical protein [Deltaproteobacteria bacterium]